MKNKHGIFAAFTAAAVAAFVAVALLYKSIAFDGMDIALNNVQTAALPVLAVLFAVVAVVRFAAPLLFKKEPDEESGEAESKEPSLAVRYLDYAAWIFFALCFSVLVASPLAGVADYIFYAALFGVLSVLCALFPTVSAAEKSALGCEKCPSAALLTAVTAILSFVPALGIYSGICATVFWVTALREEKAPEKQYRVGLTMSAICTVLAAAVTIMFVYLLF